MVVAWGDDEDGECDVPAGLTNAIAVAGGYGFSLALLNNGTVIGWGDNSYGETNVPTGRTNVVAVAAGAYHGVALLADGSVTNWGSYSDSAGGGPVFTSVTNRLYVSPPPLSNVVGIAAGLAQDLALLSNGTCVAWGFTNVYGTGAAYGTMVPTNLNLTNVSAVECGWGYNVVLTSNGAVVAWGDNDPAFSYPASVPSDLSSNVVAISTGTYNSVALRADGTVESWGFTSSGVDDTPTNLSTIVAIANNGYLAAALDGMGDFTEWGNDAEVESAPVGLTGIKAIACGLEHILVLESGPLTPVILTEPENQYAVAGHSATFTADGEGLAGLTYQWQFDGTNIEGATNGTFVLTNAQSTNQGSYDVVITSPFGSITSAAVTFTLVLPPQIISITPATFGTNWINSTNFSLSVTATGFDQTDFPISYQWSLNGTNVSGATGATFSVNLSSGQYETAGVTVSNAAGGTNFSWTVALALPGMVEAWGADGSGQCNRPVGVTNAMAIAAGEYQSVGVTDTGAALQWGKYFDGMNLYSVTNTNYVSLPPRSGVVAVAAGLFHAVALLTNGTVTTWGLNSYAAPVPTNLNGIKAVACSWQTSFALSTNGMVTAWDQNSPGGFSLTNVPPTLTNVTAIAAGPTHALAVQSNGTVVAWGLNAFGETNVPTGLTNVVAVAAGQEFSMALQSNGKVVCWGNNDSGQTNVPASMSNVMAIAAGDNHCIALINDGTLVSWGDNSEGQTNTISQEPGVGVKYIAAGGDHSMAALFSPLVQYPIDVSKDLLLIYNTNSIDSSNVCRYYLKNRPMVSNANVLGIGCTILETTLPGDFTNIFMAQITNWLYSNPTKLPSYVVLFQDMPSRVNTLTDPEPNYEGSGGTPFPSVQYQLHNWCATNWQPFVTSINMNGSNSASPYNSPLYNQENPDFPTNLFSSDGTNDCIAYINKVTNFANMGGNVGQLVISGLAAGYGNTNWYFDDSVVGSPTGFGNLGYLTEQAILGIDPSGAVSYSSNSIITQGTNLAGYYSPGIHNGAFLSTYPVNGQLIFSGNSGWYLMDTDESFNGERYNDFQGNFLEWFSSGAFGGTNYSNTPVGAGSNVDEPGSTSCNPEQFFGYWAQGRNLAFRGWNSQVGGNALYIQVIGDPFTKQ
jgi:alpha-tubulin suppressor-like RCC1 family protein